MPVPAAPQAPARHGAATPAGGLPARSRRHTDSALKPASDPARLGSRWARERPQRGRDAMTLQRAQIDVLLEDLEATAFRRRRADPDDPGLARDIIAQTRALLRVAPVDEHLYICDYSQHLLLRLGGDGEDDAAEAAEAAEAAAPPPPGDGFLRAVQPTREHVPDLGLALMDDPFDLDAYVPAEPAEPAEPVHTAAPPGAEASEPAEPADASGTPEAPAIPERRSQRVPDAGEMRRDLTAQQLRTLDTMSNFGWTLCFVRRPMFQPPMPVVFDCNLERYIVVEADGTIDDAPGLRIRGAPAPRARG